MKSLLLSIVIIKLCYGQSAEPLEPIRHNKLATGSDRYIQHARVIPRGREAYVTGYADGFYKPSVALTWTNLMNIPIISRPAAEKMLQNRQGKFMVAEVKTTYKGTNFRMFALQVSTEGEAGYWVPINEYTDIPSSPKSYEPRYVFTPDFSGCSLTITPMANNKLRVRHVQGNLEDRQFNDRADKGGPETYAMQFKDYGYHERCGEIVQNTGGFAFMEYTGREWKLNYQLQVNSPAAGNIKFNPNNGHLQSLSLLLPLVHDTESLNVYVPFSKRYSISISGRPNFVTLLRNQVKRAHPNWSDEYIDSMVSLQIKTIYPDPPTRIEPNFQEQHSSKSTCVQM